MHVVVVGVGVTGGHAAGVLRRRRPGIELTLFDRNPERAAAVAGVLGGPISVATSPECLHGPRPVDAVLLCVAAGMHAELADVALRLPAHVVSVGDAMADVSGLLDLDDVARGRERAVVAGAGFSPGLSCVLARHAADLFDQVDEIVVAKSGTGGPDCARQHHSSLKATNWEWRQGRWFQQRGSTGRRLAWFPDPVGALDCYRAALPEPVLLQRAFPGVARVSARMAATRRDRLTGWLPMLRPPHADGGPGGVRVEVWGRRDGIGEVVVYGAAHHPGHVAGSVAALAVDALMAGDLPQQGAYGLAEAADPTALLAGLAELGIRVLAFEGAD